MLIPVGLRPWPCLNAIEVAQAIASAGIETLATLLHERAPRNYGRQTAERLVALAEHSVSSGVATTARSTSLKILCDQLSHTQSNLAHLEDELDQLLDADPGAKGGLRVPEFGHKTVAVLRGELGDVARFQRIEQAIAYVGLDIEVKESGKWKGQAKLSKRGSGLVRRVLYASRPCARPDSKNRPLEPITTAWSLTE